MTTVSQPLLTADDLWRMPNDQRRELVRGELRTMAPSGFDHGVIIISLARRLANHVADHDLGFVTGAETGFRLSRDPDTVRGADVAFVRKDRVPKDQRPTSYFEGAPDLAVEVLSPSDTVEETEEKVDDYLQAGAQAVWVVNPRRRTVTVHAADGQPVIYRESETVDAGAIVAGFKVSVREILA